MRRAYFTIAGAILFATPVCAQAPVPAPAVAIPASPVDAFYASRPGVLVWLRDADTRDAAAKLLAILRRAPLDGLADGPALADQVEAALASGQPSDDKVISAAWVRYVQALKRPVDSVSYGDPALQLRPPSAEAILIDARRAAPLAAHVEQVAAVNPFYAALRDQADPQTEDPRVEASLDRLRLIPGTGRAILVDAASATLWMLENGQPVDSMKVIVGKTSSPTPLLAGTIHFVTFNPYWHILDDVARRKVAPIVLKRGVSYLKAAKYETLSSWGSDAQVIDPTTIDWKAVAAGDAHVFIRQQPGVNNMMGAMKFSFVNDFDIFLHDTPHKNLFAKDVRTLSLGCVRLEHADRLAKWLLGQDATPPSGAPELSVQINSGVPVYITYLTAVVKDGQLAFADDVYGRDTPPNAPAATKVAAATAGPNTQQR